eukprot:TRINITY_DN48798_c0_g1_i1.p1 TRINITY_DN48798_c0_g1~~TRINITY_DN48798_c0_g1_i1.p1  ORF type:complete len:413 (+),score=84.49 TRINITY_DN48798_c0_g1_i1:150-1388(+)
MTILANLGANKVVDVWGWNFHSEFQRFVKLVLSGGPRTLVAMDTEFPGTAKTLPYLADRCEQYSPLCESVNVLHPVQLGLAVSVNGVHGGAWNFNLQFDLDIDLYSEKAVSFLKKAGVNFYKHKEMGVDRGLLGEHLAASKVFSNARGPATLITFAGAYDLGYLVKLMTDQRLPATLAEFDCVLDELCPRRCELRDRCPFGSLERLLSEHQVVRSGNAHTAGSDALATLELYAKVASDGVVEPSVGKDSDASSEPVWCESTRDSSASEDNILPEDSISEVGRQRTLRDGMLWGQAAQHFVLSIQAAQAAQRSAPRSRQARPASHISLEKCLLGSKDAIPSNPPFPTIGMKRAEEKVSWGACARQAMENAGKGEVSAAVAQASERGYPGKSGQKNAWGAAARAAMEQSKHQWQ